MKQFVIAGLAVIMMSGTAFAHGAKKHVEAPDQPVEVVSNEFGMTGDPEAVSQTITVVMSDEMTFTPNVIHIKAGDTVKFVIKNDGENLHEMVLGRSEDLVKHAALMAEFPEMEHEEPYMAHVQPGKSGEVVWRFTNTGQFEFGCLIPGHYESGMKGTIVVGLHYANKQDPTLLR